MAYQRKTLVPPADVGPPGELPPELVGLTDASLADLEAAIGVEAATQLGYLNTGFFPVNVPPPNVVGNSQLRMALQDAALLDDVDAAVAASPDPHVPILWQYNSAFDLNSMWLQTVAASVGIGVPQLTNIFAAARSLPT